MAVQAMFRLEGPDAIEVVGGEREPEQHRHLNEAHNPEEPAAEISEGVLEGRVGRLDDLTACHANPPRRGPERNGLPPGQLDRHRRQDPLARLWLRPDIQAWGKRLAD